MANAIPTTATGTWYYSEPVAPKNGEPRAEVNREAEQGWMEVIDDLLSYRNYEDDYDGEGSVAPSKELIDSAIILANSLRESGELPADMVVPGVNGTIYFEWHTPTEYREIEVRSAHEAIRTSIPKGQSESHTTQLFLQR